MKKFIYIAIILLSSCYTAKQAQRDVLKANLKHPLVTTDFCAVKFPVKETVKETIKIIKGKETFKTDTITVDCDSVVKDKSKSNKIYIKGKTIYRTDTIVKTKVVYQENIAKITNLELKVKERDKSIAEKDLKINQLKSDKKDLLVTSSILLILIIVLITVIFKR